MMRVSLPAAVEAVEAIEAMERFSCFGGTCTVRVQDDGRRGSARAAVRWAKENLLEWHARFSRFELSSELSRLNRDPRECVPVSPIMMRFVRAALRAAALSEGLVDPTLLGEVEKAGYVADFPGLPSESRRPGPITGRRQAAAPHPAARWRAVSVDEARGAVTRPVGLRLDSGGVAKGLFGDVLASGLGWHESFAVDAAGDIVLGGTEGWLQTLPVASPFSRRPLHTFELARGAVATSGITRRSWLDARGAAHHLLDPATGEPAFTGIVQATALAPSGVEAETLAKAALLAGPDQARRWLPHGGVVVYEDGGHVVFEPSDSPGRG